MDRATAHPRRPADIYERHEEWGQRIHDERMGWTELSRVSGLGEKAAKTLVDIVKSEGPTPARTGSRTILVVGDAHAKPHQDLSRFSALGRMVVDIDPDVVVSIGDWADCHATGRFDRGRLSGQGARHIADMQAGNEALRLYHRELDDFNAAASVYQRRNPKHVFCVGNHEDRMSTFVEEHPELEGLMGLDQLDFERRGWGVVPFLQYHEQDGIYFVHYVHGNASRATGGVHHAHNMASKKHTPFVVGHSHGFDTKLHVDRQCGVEIRALVVGCFFEHWENYAHQSNETWWRGICVLRDVRGGRYDLETYSLDRIMRTWGE